ncbi:unnamed protein product [Urochloa decumbens]|uniref:Retrotransposon gag domain-containing protein n=1 Tax=Urochloa decumbens TaxID=240449 RepID=A0ABC9A1U3_9POAL
MDSFEIPTPIVKLEMGGANYGMWAFVTRINLQALGLFEHITGESPCPPAPVPPPRPPASAAKEVIDAANKDFKAYQSALDAYTKWDADDAHAILVLIRSVEANIIHLQLQTAQEIWAHLRQRYQPAVDAVHYNLRQQLQTLKQGDDTVEAFYDRFMALWRKLDSLVLLPDTCRGCACCEKRQQHDDKSCLYEFLIRLRPEFEPAKLRLLSCPPLPSVMEARNTLLLEEIWLERTASAVTPAQKKKKKKRSGSRPNLWSSEPSEGSSPLSQNEVARMVNQFQGLTHQGSAWSTNLPHSRNLGSNHNWDWPM